YPSTANDAKVERKCFPPVLAGEQESLRCSFALANTSKRTLTFHRVSTSCSCSQAYVEKPTLAPGENTSVWIEANLAGRTGTQMLTCRVEAEDGTVHRYDAEITIIPRMRLTPSI